MSCLTVYPILIFISRSTSSPKAPIGKQVLWPSLTWPAPYPSTHWQVLWPSLLTHTCSHLWVLQPSPAWPASLGNLEPHTAQWHVACLGAEVVCFSPVSPANEGMFQAHKSRSSMVLVEHSNVGLKGESHTVIR